MTNIDKNDNNDDLDLWMIRPCEIYSNEYNECTAITSRLHQIFVHGVTLDCNHWHEDYTNCLKWKNDKNIQCAKTLVQSEKNKRIRRWKSFYENNVWESRKTPPENWNDPLPDYIANRKTKSTFKETVEELNEGSKNNSFCSIM